MLYANMRQCRRKVNVYTPSTLSVKPKIPCYIYDRDCLSETLNCRYPRQIALHMGFIHYDNLCNPFSALWPSLDLGAITGRVCQRSFQDTWFYYSLAIAWCIGLHIILMLHLHGCTCTKTLNAEGIARTG